ncbi:MAG: AAA family ATPase [Opitutae bacterium]|nr:AAA family ATPase [Opitutae bacterium]
MNGKIWAVTGTLGGGKTTLGAEVALIHLRGGGWMFTNVAFFADRVREWMAEGGRKFDPSRLVMLTGELSEFHKQVFRGTPEQPVLVLIDEASLDFNARDYRDTSRDLLAFVNFVRKLDIHLVFITQRFEDLDKQFRARVAELFVCRNMKALKIWGIIPCPLPFYFRVRFDNTRGNGRPVKLDSEVVFRSWAWGLFDSNALTGKGHEQFLAMQTAHASPLEKIERPAKPSASPLWPYLLAAFSAALFSSF